ncbi:class I SAM-dependent methyltransferase [Phenylobacterium sp.]|uniref:class I SAM-dependent methyltransferase n=1 Tax=Phenylobacterium sp. TaxID=1871053 RepID=UPI002B9CF68F|nr:class I SAM-dependent methyltransferase [Phenylobacterium sp.]HVI33733.1 class I SAM-dependent methyltransferase [Phenylobacterium sp.]
MPSVAEDNLVACFPERSIAGFSRLDLTFLFYSYIHALIGPTSSVLDLGAGRGAHGGAEISDYKRRYATLQGRVGRVVGADVDPAVLQNPHVDEAVVFDPCAPLPFPDATFDVVLSDWVLEHVEDPASFAREVERVLKPGGWFCARTPNRFGIVAMGATLIPNSLHSKAISILQPGRSEVDVFPTRYRLNTESAIRRYFPEGRWRNCSFTHSAEIMYFARSRALLRITSWIGGVVPAALRPFLLVFVQKRPTAAPDTARTPR